MKVNLDSTRFLHLGTLLACSFILGYTFHWYLERSILTSMGASVTIVCQINNVMIMSSDDVRKKAIRATAATTTTTTATVDGSDSNKTCGVVDSKITNNSKTNKKKTNKKMKKKET